MKCHRVLLLLFLANLLLSVQAQIGVPTPDISKGKDGQKPDKGTSTSGVTTEENLIQHIKRFPSVTKSSSVEIDPNSKLPVGPNSTIIYNVEEQGKPIVTITTQNQTVQYGNGTMGYVETETQKTIYPSKVIRTIRTNWAKLVKIVHIKEIIRKFREEYGAKKLTKMDYDLFNTIVATHGNSFQSSYQYIQVKAANLRTGIRKAVSVIKTKFTEDDLSFLENEIRQCKQGTVLKIFNPYQTETRREDKFEIRSEMFCATCSKDAPEFQIFAWSGSKSGVFLPGYFNTANMGIVTKVLTFWLNEQPALLFD